MSEEQIKEVKEALEGVFQENEIKVVDGSVKVNTKEITDEQYQDLDEVRYISRDGNPTGPFCKINIKRSGNGLVIHITI